jgi:hypothetical protein
MADEQKKMKIHPLALAEIVGSGGFTHYGVPEEGEDASPPDEKDLPEGASIEDQKEETVKLKDAGHDQETGEEQQVILLKITNHAPFLASFARPGVPAPPPENADADAAESGAEKKTPQSENEDS